MSIKINKAACVSCGQCLEVCPGNLIHYDSDEKAYIKYPNDCWGCTSCVKSCKKEAIRFYLGADIGGRGSTVYTQDSNDSLKWIIEKPDGTKEIIEINKKNSNQY